MFKIASAAFLAVPNPQNKRVLVEGKVQTLGPAACEIEFEHVAALAGASDVTLFAEVRGKFFQHAARLTAESVVDGRTLLAFELIGEAVSAEQRGSYRTSAVMLNLPIRVDAIAGCILADVSPEGVGVICPKPLLVGAMVDVVLEVDGYKVVERMKVQGSKPLPSGKLRFGMFVPTKGSTARHTLERLASHLQRMQLKRLSGAA